MNRTGTDRVWPVARLTGSAGAVAPNGAAVPTAEIVTARAAVTVTVAVPVLPTATLPKSVGELVSAAVVGRPKPKTLPSRVPT